MITNAGKALKYSRHSAIAERLWKAWHVALHDLRNQAEWFGVFVGSYKKDEVRVIYELRFTMYDLNESKEIVPRTL